ncbi:MAG: glycosyltransferase [Lachnospiraceae bacterium]|jgi:Glycosyltransferases involved in cell wall biogenesis|nr:glycosyltransferase [Lachnospiraceae bacterium]
MDVKVSVIIPVYNEEKYLPECLESVIRQTLKEIEIICVDDGSMDHSVQIIRGYCEIYPRIKLVMQENQGAGVARNNAMLKAQGRFVCFLDADDYYISEDALETVYNTAVEVNADICAGLLQTEVKGKIERDPVLRNLLREKDKVRVCYQDFQFDYQYQCYLYKRSFLNRHKIEFPDYKRFQDPPFFVQAMFYAKEFAVVRTELYFYRRGNQAPQFTDIKTRDLLEGLLFNLKFAKEHNLEILFGITLSRINQDYFDVLYSGLERYVPNLKERFMEAEQMVKERNLFFEPLELHLLKNEKQRSNALFDKIKKKTERNVEVLIYGAGNVGKKCALYLLNSRYADMVMWIDHYKCGLYYFSCKICDLQDISSVRYDKVLIAVENCVLSNQIKSELLRWGVLESTITEWCEAE